MPTSEVQGSPYGARTLLPVTDVRFSQASIFPTLTNGTALSEFFKTLTVVGWNDDFEPPRVVRMKGKSGSTYVAFDNRRSVSLRWLFQAGLKDSAYFRVFDSDQELVDEVRSADIGLQYSKFGVDVSEADLAALAETLGSSLEALASQASFKRGDRPKTWGDVLLARTSSQRQWGAPDFPLLGQSEIPWVKWDILEPYVAHCKRLLDLPKDHPIVHFAAPRCMFDRRSKEALVDFLRTMPREQGAVSVQGGVPEFSTEWSRLLQNMHRWCDDVLEGNVHCVDYAWRPAAVQLGAVGDGSGYMRGADLLFGPERVDMVVSLEWTDGKTLELTLPVADRDFKRDASKASEATASKASLPPRSSSETTLSYKLMSGVWRFFSWIWNLSVRCAARPLTWKSPDQTTQG